MSTVERIAEALRTQPLAAGPYALELADQAVVDQFGAFRVLGTFRGLEDVYGQSDAPRGPYEESVGLSLLASDEDPEFAVGFARAWAALVQRAFESMATHPAAKGRFLGPASLAAYGGHERAVKNAKKARGPDALREALDQTHPLAAFVGCDPADYEKLRALLEADLDDELRVLGRSPRLALELVRYEWRVSTVLAAVQYFTYEEDGATIRNIIEQEVYLAGREHMARPERVLALIKALRAECADRLAQAECVGDYAAATPFDLLGDLASVLALKRPSTREQFSAVLRSRWKL